MGWATCYVGGILGDTLFRPPHFTDEVSTTILSQSMVLIEAKRFLSIVSPIKRLLNYSEKNWIFVCFTWVPSILFMSYYFCIYELVDTNDGMICNYN